MTECYFCGNPLVALLPIEEIGDGWTRTSKTSPDAEWACKHCVNKKIDSYNG